MAKLKLKQNINSFSQLALPSLTVSAQIAIALKYPEWGLLLNLLSQPFWIYSGWKSYKSAGQIGIFITTVTFTIITIGGVINYWIL